MGKYGKQEREVGRKKETNKKGEIKIAEVENNARREGMGCDKTP